MTGRLSRPGDPGYPLDLQLYDPIYDKVRPTAVAFCASAPDVARCVDFARRHSLRVAARSGGHSYGGYSTTTGMVIDVSLMSQVACSGRGATVGPGARLIDVYSGLAPYGVSIPAGSCPSVGIAGLCLGGGIGVMSRLYGLTCDRLTSVQVVTAAGETVRADATVNSDLFWACRGAGGGNFGIVTELKFRTFQVQDLALFTLYWPWQAASQVLPAWAQWVEGAPDELWSNLQLSADPGGTAPTLKVAGVWAGTEHGALAQMAELGRLAATAGRPSGTWVSGTSFEEAMYVEAGCAGVSQAACHVAGKTPAGTLPRAITVAKSDILNRPLSDRGVSALLAGIEERNRQGGPGGAIIDSWGGAINRARPDATAFVHRSALASVQYLANFSPGSSASDVAAARLWMASWHASMRPFVSGEAYQNYIDPGLTGWPKAYYGANLARLQQVKSKWDKDNFFRFAQGVALPSVAGQPRST